MVFVDEDGDGLVRERIGSGGAGGTRKSPEETGGVPRLQVSGPLRIHVFGPFNAFPAVYLNQLKFSSGWSLRHGCIPKRVIAFSERIIRTRCYDRGLRTMLFSSEVPRFEDP